MIYPVILMIMYNLSTTSSSISVGFSAVQTVARQFSEPVGSRFNSGFSPFVHFATPAALTRQSPGHTHVSFNTHATQAVCYDKRRASPFAEAGFSLHRALVRGSNC